MYGELTLNKETEAKSVLKINLEHHCLLLTLLYPFGFYKFYRDFI